jgi:DNA-binding beta-propeller fold protein YncE
MNPRRSGFAFNHTGKSVTIIDAASGAVVASTPLSGVVEAGQADATIGKVFINIEDTSAVDVVDMLTFKVVANYKVAPAEEPTGMAVDPTTHHLFVGGGPNLVMMDTRTGAVLASVGICGGTDATFYDAALKTAFVSCRDGHIAVVAVIGNTLKVTETITTTPGARTMALDPLTHRLYVAGGDRAVADSFRVLVFAPGR